MISRSEDIAELAEALSAAQKKMGAALKDAEAHHGNYADLASVVQAIKEPLAEQGLSYTQLPIRESESAGVTTLLMHKSGQFIESSYTLPLAKFDSQSVGSCITYARRYALQAISGIPSDDDDGSAATDAAPDRLSVHYQAVGKNWTTVAEMTRAIDAEEWETAVEAWDELDNDDKQAIFGISPTDGNVAFTTAHRRAIKSEEFYAANKAMYGKRLEEQEDAGAE